MLTGEYRISLDEAGRLLVPTRLRSDISGNSLVVTRGIDTCLWLLSPEEWRKLSSGLIKVASPFQKTARLLQRRLIAPAQEIELDKSGRLKIPVTLLEYASLNKDCMMLGIEKYLEIWDMGEYQKYIEQTDSEFKEAAEELGGRVFF